MSSSLKKMGARGSSAQTSAFATKDRALTIVEAARFANVSSATIYRRILEGALPAMRRGRAWRISEQTLVDFSETLKHGPAPKEILEFKLREKGDLAKKCFPLFEDRVPIQQVVIQLGADPMSVRQLFEEWKRCRALNAQYSENLPAPEQASAEVVKFSHEPNADFTCCRGHAAQRRMKLLEEQRQGRQEGVQSTHRGTDSGAHVEEPQAAQGAAQAVEASGAKEVPAPREPPAVADASVIA